MSLLLDFIVFVNYLLTAFLISEVLFILYHHFRSSSKKSDFGRFEYGKNPKWIYEVNKQSSRGGFYRWKDETIHINPNSIMEWADDEQDALIINEEIVIHELCHWAAKHDASDKIKGKISSDHSQKWREVLKPLISPNYGIENYER